MVWSRQSWALTGFLIVATVPARAEDRPVQLQVPPEVEKGVAAMPQIAEPVDDAERKINAATRRLDANVRKAALRCRKDGGGRSSWERTVNVTMRGPRFLSYQIIDNVFCGGAYPDLGTMAIVYDLTTGAPVNWTTLLPASLTGAVALQPGADGTKMVTLASKRLQALYLAAYRPQTGARKPDEADSACRGVVASTDSEEPPAMMAWLDAKQGGLAVHVELPHAAQECADTVVISTATLRREGAQPVLVDAIDAAHALRPAP
jgi:hypothetical protein